MPLAPQSKELGEVDERILNAARKIFVEGGFEGASIDEIADAARAGKPTIYARFGDKRALFTAVMTRDVVARITQFKVRRRPGRRSKSASRFWRMDTCAHPISFTERP
ncbi:MAG TPA: helix-turn-helix domain-containing protein [Pseudolabrys sp.]|nr:helix-turn-helix domain-containing protein [Pseudolabrys sp.]